MRQGVKYPQWPAQKSGEVHRSDYLSPCYIRGRKVVRFYGLNSVDLATGRCATEPVLRKTNQHTIDAFWAIAEARDRQVSCDSTYSKRSEDEYFRRNLFGSFRGGLRIRARHCRCWAAKTSDLSGPRIDRRKESSTPLNITEILK